jgi:hypothetical protein
MANRQLSAAIGYLKIRPHIFEKNSGTVGQWDGGA